MSSNLTSPDSSTPSTTTTTTNNDTASTSSLTTGDSDSVHHSTSGSGLEYTPERKDELTENYQHTLSLVQSAFSRRSSSSSDPESTPSSPKSASSSRSLSLSSLSLSSPSSKPPPRPDRPFQLPLLLPISKLKPASDIVALYDAGVRDFGENYVQELQEKSELLKHLEGIRWHFVGGLQSNKCKALAGIPNLYAVHAIDSSKKADALDRALSSSSSSSSPSSSSSTSSSFPQLNVYIQINTSLEPQKSGLPPPFTSSPFPLPSSSSSSSSTRPSTGLPGSTAALDLATHIATRCPRLRLVGLMTIGALEGDPKEDFGTLRKARERTEKHLRAMAISGKSVGRLRLRDGKGEGEEGGGGEEGGDGEEEDVRLDLSMGMSADFEVAVEMGSDCVRVGTGIFGERPKKKDAKVV